MLKISCDWVQQGAQPRLICCGQVCTFFPPGEVGAEFLSVISKGLVRRGEHPCPGYKPAKKQTLQSPPLHKLALCKTHCPTPGHIHVRDNLGRDHRPSKTLLSALDAFLKIDQDQQVLQQNQSAVTQCRAAPPAGRCVGIPIHTCMFINPLKPMCCGTLTIKTRREPMGHHWIHRVNSFLHNLSLCHSHSPSPTFPFPIVVANRLYRLTDWTLTWSDTNCENAPSSS